MGGQGIDFNIKTVRNGSKNRKIDNSNSEYQITVTNYRPQDVDYAIWSESSNDRVEFENDGVELTSCTVTETVAALSPQNVGKDQFSPDIFPNQVSNIPEDIDISVRYSDVLPSVSTKTEKADPTIDVDVQ